MEKCNECMCKCMWVREREGEGETASLRKIRYESEFRQASFRVASRLTSFTSVLHPQGWIPLTTLPHSALTMPGDVRDVEPLSTDVNAVWIVPKIGDDVTFGSRKFHLSFSHTCLDFTHWINQENIKLIAHSFTLWFQAIWCIPHSECSNVATKADKTFPSIPIHTWLTSKFESST